MTNLAKNAMLVSVTIINGGLLGERLDNTATNLVTSTYAIADRRAKASKWLIDRKHKSVKNVVAASQRVRNVVYRYTMPWGDDKSRLLSVEVYEDFNKAIKDAEGELKNAWDRYILAYPSLIADSERALGDLFDRSQYPLPERAKDMFRFSITLWPIPLSENFVANLTNKAATAAKEAIEKEIEQRLHDSTVDLARRARETVTTFVEKLKSFKSNADGNRAINIFRDSLVDNCQHTGALIKALNFTNHKGIYDIANELCNLGLRSAEMLRTNPESRVTAIKRGEKLLKNLIKLENQDREISAMIVEASEYPF